MIYSLDPETIVNQFVCVYNTAKESYADNDPISTLTDRSLRGLGLTLTGTSTARPTFKTNQVNGKGCARFDGVNDVMIAATALNWAKLHTECPLSIYIVCRTASIHLNKLSTLLSTVTIGRGIYIGLDDISGTPAANRVSFQQTRSTGASVDVYNTNDYAYNDLQWNLISLRFFGDNRTPQDLSASLIRLLCEVNGVPTHCSSGTDILTWDDEASAPGTALKVGAWGTVSADFFTGDLAYLAIADTYFTEQEHVGIMRHLQQYFNLPFGGVVDASPGFNATPNIVPTRDGGIALQYVKRTGDEGRKSEGLVEVRSGNKGRSWSRTRSTSWFADITMQNSFVLLHSTGVWLRGLNKWNSPIPGNPTDIDAFVQRSTDGGKTWGSLIQVDAGMTGGFQELGDITEMDDGSLVLSIYGHDTGGDSYLTQRTLRSTDVGVTWSGSAIVFKNLAGQRSYIEAGLVNLGGNNVMCYARRVGSLDSPVTAIVRKLSTDKGVSWGTATTETIVLDNYGGTPIARKLASGNIVLLARIEPPTPDGRYIARWSADGSAFSSTDYFVTAKGGFSTAADLREVSSGLMYLATSCGIVVGGSTQELFDALLHGVYIKESDLVAYS